MRRVAVFLLLLGAVAFAEVDVDALVNDLGGDDIRRNEAYSILRELKDPRALPLLIKALPGFAEYNQYLGIMVLETYPPATAERAFKTLLFATSPYLRLASAEVLHRRGAKDMPARIAGALTASDLSVAVKHRMLSRLTWGRAPKDKAVLRAVRGYLRADETPLVVCEALRVVKGVEDRGAIPACRVLVESAIPGLRAAALALLYRFGEEQRALELAAVLRSGDVGYQGLWTVDVLLRDLEHVDPVVPEALVVLVDARAGNDSYLRELAGFLARLGHRKAVPALRRLVDHKSPSVAKAAADAVAELTGTAKPGTASRTLAAKDTEELAELIGKKDVETLRTWLKDERAARRVMAADALRRMDDLSGLVVVLAELADPKSNERADAARILGGFRVAAAVEPLLAALADPNGLVRSRALSSLGYVLTTLFPYRNIRLADTGYGAYATAEKRAAGLVVIRTWWEQNRDKGW